MTVITIRREFFPVTPVRPGAEPVIELSEEEWREATSGGHRVGPVTAPVTIVEFADYECPACRQFALTILPDIREKWADQVAIIYRHWPLPYHRFAYPAARALECALKQGHFQAMHDSLYANQKEFGLKSFTAIAIESGIPDSSRHAACMADQAPLPNVDADAKAAQKLGAKGTPTILLNGKRLEYVPTAVQLDELITGLVAQKR
jgi:protein-disulfide isomerase